MYHSLGGYGVIMQIVKKKIKNIKKHAINAMIIIERKKERVFGYVPPHLIPANSYLQLHNGRMVHWLGLDMNNEFWVIDEPQAVKDRMPGGLFVATNLTRDLVKKVYGTHSDMVEKIKLGIFVGLIIAILIVIFLITASSGS